MQPPHQPQGAEKETGLYISVSPIGAGLFTHDLQCWLCYEAPAVYRGYPNWDFVPCWACQAKYVGVWTKRTLWQKLKERFL